MTTFIERLLARAARGFRNATPLDHVLILGTFFVMVVAALLTAPHADARPTGDNVPAYCPALDSGRRDAPGIHKRLTVRGPAGTRVSAVCFQTFTDAGQAVLEYVTLTPARGAVTIRASRDIGHYSLSLVSSHS